MPSRLPSLLSTAVGAYGSAHLQMGIGGFWGFAADELSVVVFCLAAGALAFAIFAACEWLVRASVPARYSLLASTVTVVVMSLCLGLLFYGSLLPRSISTALERDLPFVLSFAVLAVAYFAGRVVEVKRELKSNDV